MVKIIRYFIRPIKILLILTGILLSGILICDVYIGDSSLPEFTIPKMTTVNFADQNLSGDLTGYKNHNHEDYWKGMQGALKILDEINPTISNWVRERNNSKKLNFVFSNGMFAKYDYLKGQLTITSLFFAANEGRKASYLAHEYRHSRQNYGKLARHILSFAYGGSGYQEIIENDAYLYEHEAYSAILRQPYTKGN